MYINTELLHSEYEDSNVHLKKMLQSGLTNMSSLSARNKLDLFRSLDTLKCINDFCSLHEIEGIDILGKDLTQPSTVLTLLRKYYTESVFNSPSNSFSHHFSKSKYEFTEDEYQNIQDAINELRKNIQQTKIFGDDHQGRLLKKLEALQKELHQKMNSLDKVLGQITSIGITLGKFGKDTKPMFDRFNETFKIVNKVEERGDDVTPIDNQIGYEEMLEIELIEETPSDTV